MRNAIGGMVAAALAIVTGCAGGKTEPAAHTEQAGETHPCMMQAGGENLIRVSVSGETHCEPSDGHLHLWTKEYHGDIWLARGRKTVDEAAEIVGQTIHDEFRNFKQNAAADTRVAGVPAKRIAGIGVEADDGDPGRADVVVFKLGDNVFIACVHGEHLTAADADWLMAILNTAHRP